MDTATKDHYKNFLNTEIMANKGDINNNIDKTIPSSNSFEAMYLKNLLISSDNGMIPLSDSINSIFDYNLKITNQPNSLDTIVQSEEETLDENKAIENRVATKILSFQKSNLLKKGVSLDERKKANVSNHINAVEIDPRKEENNTVETKLIENNVATKIQSFQGQSLLKRAGSLDGDRKKSNSNLRKNDATNLPQIENLKNETRISFTGSCHSVKDLRGKFESNVPASFPFNKFVTKKTPIPEKKSTNGFQPTDTTKTSDSDQINVKVKDRVSDLNKASVLAHTNDKKCKDSKTTLKSDSSLTISQKSFLGEDVEAYNQAKGDFSKINKSKVLVDEHGHEDKEIQIKSDHHQEKELSHEVTEKKVKQIISENKKNLSSSKSPIFFPFKTQSVISHQSENCTKILMPKNIPQHSQDREEMFNNSINSKALINFKENMSENHITSDKINDLLKREIDYSLKENLGDILMQENKVDEKLMQETLNKLCESIKKALSENFDNHKFIVKSVIGYSLFEMPVVSHQCYWDENSDSCSTYSFSKGNYFITVTAFALFKPTSFSS
jgi:hypothetical protein